MKGPPPHLKTASVKRDHIDLKPAYQNRLRQERKFCQWPAHQL